MYLKTYIYIEEYTNKYIYIYAYRFISSQMIPDDDPNIFLALSAGGWTACFLSNLNVY